MYLSISVINALKCNEGVCHEGRGCSREGVCIRTYAVRRCVSEGVCSVVMMC